MATPTKPNASKPALTKTIVEKKAFLEEQLKSLEKVQAVADLLKSYSAETQREALKGAGEILGCAKPRKPRTRKEKPAVVEAAGEPQPAPAA